MAPNVFAVPVFLVVFRETLETAIIVSVLLAFLKQTLSGPNQDAKVYKKLVLQVWYICDGRDMVRTWGPCQADHSRTDM
jgi:high-affinity iron transporter